MENLPKNYNGSDLMKDNSILEIAKRKISKTFRETNGKLNTHFDAISKKCRQSSVCVSVLLSLPCMQKAWFEIYLRFIRNQTYRIFYLIYVHYIVVSDQELSLSWKYQFSKKNKFCKSHIDSSPEVC